MMVVGNPGAAGETPQPSAGCSKAFPLTAGKEVSMGDRIGERVLGQSTAPVN